ncbi:MAG TPA: hypothetical protein VIM94_11495 [Salegentibacter sp.]|uniref:hypothetical protein n=1 Tax=Salegentibacter sp. TaxID=1903072 RepID=UPI002F949F0B
MTTLLTNTALGFALITGVVLLAVVIYSIIKLRKQVRKAKEKEENKKAGNP